MSNLKICLTLKLQLLEKMVILNACKCVVTRAYTVGRLRVTRVDSL